MEALAHTDLPILLIHGEEDHFVPCDMSRSLQAAHPTHTTLVTFPGAGHGLSYISDPGRYEKICFDFLYNVEALKNQLQNCEIAQNLRSHGMDI